MSTFAAGSLVEARGREWLVVRQEEDALWVRPLTGNETESTWLIPAIERTPVKAAQFPPPSLRTMTNPQGARLLADALRLSLRRGAGPFRSLGHVAVEPRPYQLVPLLMALRQDPVRLLIADSVGIGKTIEAGLIARELLDRGEIDRIAVLCPPHLVSQWCDELRTKFSILAQPVTASTAARLERGIPHGGSLFDQYPSTVVSLDYIKSDRRRDDFARACPGFVIVDEAHACTQLTGGKQLRYELLRKLADKEDRHLVLLSATPHSGNEGGFYKLLGLLDREFEELGTASDERRETLRTRLARHFVQRRRVDVEQWDASHDFPDRLVAEATYRLSNAEQRFFENVLAWCRRVTEAAGTDERRRRLTFWGTLALMRCVGSSPAAAVQALSTRMDTRSIDDAVADDVRSQVTDGEGLDLPDNDGEPAAPLLQGGERTELEALLSQAKGLRTAPDSKLQLLERQLEPLLTGDEPARPVVFCRYVSTARYLKERLAKACESWGVTCDVVTGEVPDDERRRKVDALAEHDRYLLIATDCLSEGINLQVGYDAVIHYDLSWNPTRHEQREGRVDRFGQRRKQVRALTLYGENNPVDGAVLQVILRKAEAIRRELGVPVPMPDEGGQLTEALMSALLLRQGPTRQLDLLATAEGRAAEAAWQSARERTKRTQTLFAQRGMRPEDVLPEWQRQQALLGSPEALERFCREALARLNVPVAAGRHGYTVNLEALPGTLLARLEESGLPSRLRFDFKFPPGVGCDWLHRSHPLAVGLAEHVLGQAIGERTRDAAGVDAAVVARAGAWVSAGVAEPTWVALLRLRHRLIQGRSETLVEEAVLVAWSGTERGTVVVPDAARAALEAPPAMDLQASVRERRLADFVAWLQGAPGPLAALARERSAALADDHERVRQATGRRFAGRAKVSVESLLPADIVGVFYVHPKVG